MHWLFGARRLRELGILGINRRNGDCILATNPRSVFPLVDDKLRMQRLCATLGVPTPAIYSVIERHAQLRKLQDFVAAGDMVIKPARGSGGRGVLVFTGSDAKGYRRHNGEIMPIGALSQHCCSVLAGLFSLGGRPDSVIVQQRVLLHPEFEPIAFQGVPDLRIVLYRGEPAMAMLRLPTRASGGRANLHQGGLGAGIDLDSGRTCHAVCGSASAVTHPDTGANLIDRPIPHWQDVLTMARKIASAVKLGYLGVDIVIDANAGPLLLEANARPGLAIQIANAAGLRDRIAQIDRRIAAPQPAIRMPQPEQIAA